MTGTWRLRGYVVEQLLGAGASSEVWRGRVARTGEPVALKRLVLRDAEQLRRAAAEAAKLRVLDHPHLVRLLDFVIDGPAAVLVLDLAEGGSLSDLLAVRGRLTPGEVITAAAPVAAALAHAHASGIVHGDVSAANVLFSREGRSLLADLGVARLTGDESDAESTPAYVDPLVARGAIPTAHTDVFMLGAVALHALTGVPLWQGNAAEAVFDEARDGRLEHVERRLVEAHVPDPVAAVIRRALHLEPVRRGTAADFALDLRHSGRPVAVELRAGRLEPRPQPQDEPVAHRIAPSSGRHAAMTGGGGTVGRSVPPRSVPPRSVPPRSVRPASGPRGGRHAALPVTGSLPTPAERVRQATERPRSDLARPALMPVWRDAAPPPDFPEGLNVGADPDPSPRERPGGISPSAPGRAAPTNEVSRLRPELPQPRQRPPRLMTAVCAVAVVLAATVVSALLWGRSRGAPALAEPLREAPVPVHASPAVHTSTAVHTSPPSGSPVPTTHRQPEAVSPHLAAVLRALDASRAAAFAERDATLFRRVYVAGPLLRADTALLERLVPPGCGLLGARTRYSDVTGRQVGRVTVVTARAGLPASRLICAQQRSTAPAIATTRIRLTLIGSGRATRIAGEQVLG